jgi:arsenate reductase-like glutaredoxin family protein
MGRDSAVELLKGADHLYASKGKKVQHFDLAKDKLEDAVEAMLGPTGNLRAPTLRKGRTLIVGFDEVTYRELL